MSSEVPESAPVFTPKTRLEKEFAEIAPKDEEKVIVTNFPSSFGKTDLHVYLQGLGDVGKKVVIVGYMAHICVSTTTRAAAGYDVVLVKDAIGGRDIPGAAADTLVHVALSQLADAFATVISEGDIPA